MSEQVNEQVNTEPVEVPESMTKEYEDALYPSDEAAASKVEESESEKTTVVSEDPVVEDEVTEAKEDKSDDEPVKPEEDKEKADEEEFKLELSEESILEQALGKEVLKEVEAFAKENGLSNEAAQAMLKREEAMLQKLQDANAEAFDNRVESWRQDVLADKQLGGENFEKTKLDAQKAVKHFGDEDFIKILNETGYGNNPSVVRFLANIGALMQNDSLIASGKEQPGEKPLHEYFYGS